MMIGLVLVGGGISSAGIMADIRHQRLCDAARAENRPDEAELCARTGIGSSGSHTNWFSHARVAGGSRGDGRSGSARGGFGGFGGFGHGGS
jgi:hypothetical protein